VVCIASKLFPLVSWLALVPFFLGPDVAAELGTDDELDELLSPAVGARYDGA